MLRDDVEQPVIDISINKTKYKTIKSNNFLVKAKLIESQDYAADDESDHNDKTETSRNKSIKRGPGRQRGPHLKYQLKR